MKKHKFLGLVRAPRPRRPGLVCALDSLLVVALLVFVLLYFRSLNRAKEDLFSKTDTKKVLSVSSISVGVSTEEKFWDGMIANSTSGVKTKRRKKGRKGAHHWSSVYGRPLEVKKKHDEWSMAAPLVERNYSNKIIIVEEHHEVLQYWMQDSSLPKEGNILVHIDAHEDSSLPSYIPNYPWFSWPKNKQELRLMMQQNDKFIMGAIMSGLISRLVFIWPSWDFKNHSSPYEEHNLTLGWYRPDELTQTNKTVQHCSCELTDSGAAARCIGPSANKNSNQSVVYYWADEESGELAIDPADCNMKVQFTFTEIQDIKAVDMLERGELSLADQHFILDVDEDFFGCEPAAERFKKVNLKWEAIEKLDQLLGTLFCVKDVKLERVVDRFLTDAINRMITTGETYQTINLRKLLRKWPGVSCKIHPDFRFQLITDIMGVLMGFTEEQLKVLARIGFCMETSPVSYNADDPNRAPIFEVCKGATTPGNKFVTHHIPTPQEIDLQSVTLEKILKKLPKPDFVGVCRSFRDGYTPKEHFPQIEKNILTSLKKHFPMYKSVHYDANLLGGPDGWFKRNRRERKRSS